MYNQLTANTVLLLFALGVLIAAPAAAQVPAFMSYQGHVLDSDGNPAVGPVDLGLGIWSESEAGTQLYAETHPQAPLTDGAFSVLLGRGNDTSGDFGAELFSVANLWLELTVDGEKMAPRKQLGSVAYAFRAAEAAHAAEAVRVAGMENGELISTAGGTFSGPIGVDGPGGAANVRMGASPGQPGHGRVGVHDGEGVELAYMGLDEVGQSVLSVLGLGREQASMGSFVSGGGFVETLGPNGKRNVELSRLRDHPDNGFVGVYDAADKLRASLFVDANGEGKANFYDSAGVVRTTATAGGVSTFGPKGKLNAGIESGLVGRVFAANDQGVRLAELSADSFFGGQVTVKNPDGNANVRIGGSLIDPQLGEIVVHDDGVSVGTLYADAGGFGGLALGETMGAGAAELTGDGTIATFGPSGAANVLLTDGFTSMSGPEARDRGAILVGDASGLSGAEMRVDDNDQGAVSVFASDGAARGAMAVGEDGAGVIATFGAESSINVIVGSLGANPDHGVISVADAEGDAKAGMYVDASRRGTVWVANEDGGTSAVMEVAATREGVIATGGPSGSENVRISSPAGVPDHGAISVKNGMGQTRGIFEVIPRGAGHITLLGPNGNDNVRLTAIMNPPNLENHGLVTVHDESGSVQAVMGVNPSGEGEIIADVKSFVVEHPTRPGFKIRYASLEGPEAAMYHRGVVRLEAGRGVIELPEHFSVLAVPESMTVQLTPRSLDSFGVAVDVQREDRIEIAELMGGNGDYDVHFLVHAVRRGYEDYDPIVTPEQFAAGYATMGLAD